MNHRLSNTAHFLTIDARDYYEDAGFDRVVPRDRWETLESRLEASVDRLLGCLQGAGTRATFFVPAGVARKNPSLVRRIAGSGNEVAALGGDELLTRELTPWSLRADARSSKAELEDATGTLVAGYRAPFCMLASARDWALEVLVEEGYEYDSSCIPQSASQFGSPAIPSYAHLIECAAGTIAEVPPTPIHSFFRAAAPGIVSPLRGASYGTVRRAFEARTRSALAGVLQLSAWEIDPKQPRLSAPFSVRRRHYNGLRRVESKLDRLLRDFRFDAIGYALGDISRTAPLMRVA